MEKVRGFENITGYDNELPKRSTKHSAGYDIKALEDIFISPNTVSVFKTGTKAYMQNDEVLKLHIRSSLAIKRGLKLVNQTGIIDSDYYNNPDNEGHILVAIENTGKESVFIRKGEKICQAIFEKFLMADGDIAEGERSGGIGSTGA